MLDGKVLRYCLKGHKDHDDFAGRRDKDTGRAKEVPREDADHGCRNQLTDEYQQQQRIQKLLGRFGQPHEGLGTTTPRFA